MRCSTGSWRGFRSRPCSCTAPKARIACGAIKARTGCAVIKALQVAEAGDLAPVSSYAAVADMLLFDARPPKEPGRLPGGNGLAFDWRLLAGPAGRLPVAALGRPVGRQSRCGGHAVPSARGRRLVGGRVPAWPQGPGEDPALPRACPRPRRSGARRPAQPSRVPADDPAQHLSGRPRRARPVRHLRRPLRRRDPDAADPRARARLRGGQGRSGLSGRAGRLARRLCGPADALVSRRAAQRPARRRARLLQARRAHPYRRAQDQQHDRPDPARPAHGQAPHHRRDRRRPARRGDRDRGGAPRPGVRRLHGRARHRAAAAERVPHAPARRRGARR